MKRIDSTHYVHPSGLHVVQKADKTWSVYDTFEDDAGGLRNELAVKHRSRREAEAAASSWVRRNSEKHKKRLRDFMGESVKLKLGKMSEVEFEHRPTRTTAKLVGGDTSMYLTGVHTPPEHRGRGGAHEVMKMVTGYLDANGRRGSLKAKPQESSVSVRRLEKLYKRHGFVKGEDGMMRREPKR